MLTFAVIIIFLPDVLAVVVGAEHVELDVDRVARVLVLGDDGVGAHLRAEVWSCCQNWNEIEPLMYAAEEIIRANKFDVKFVSSFA